MLAGPNLFTYAPSELSQDAFLAWLLAWASDEHADADPALHRTGRHFVEALLEKCGRAVPDFRCVKVRTQHPAPFDEKAGAIDVFATLDDAVVILIEDKVRAGTHGDQLRRYLGWAQERYGEENVAAVYLKTFDQASYKAAEKAGFTPFLRGDLLRALDQGTRFGARNDILTTFHAYLQGIEARVAAYTRVPVPDWPTGPEGRDLRAGFFMRVQEAIPEARWAYVNNPSGGFMALWWGFEKHDGGMTYLQLEDDVLTFRIEVDERERRKALRSAWHARIVEAARESGLTVKRPGRFGYGRTMRVAEVSPYLMTDSDGLLDLDATLSQLREAHGVLEQARCT